MYDACAHLSCMTCYYVYPPALSGFILPLHTGIVHSPPWQESGRHIAQSFSLRHIRLLNGQATDFVQYRYLRHMAFSTC